MFKNVASQKIVLLAIDTANNVPKTGDAANLTAYVSKDNGAVTVLGDTTATELDATNAPGLYSFDLTQTETNADQLIFSGKSSTANIKLVPRIVDTYPATGILAPTTSGRTLDVDASGGCEVGSFQTGAITSAAFAAGAIDAAAIAADAIGASELAADAATEIATAVLGTAVPGAFGAGTVGKLIGDNVNATISSRATQTSVDTVDDFLDTEIAAIKAKTDSLTFTVAGVVDANATHWGGTAVASAVVLSAANINTAAITAAKFGAGAIDAAAIADNAIDAGSIATGAITAAKFASGAIDAAALAADAGTEIAVAVHTRQMTEAYAADGVAPTLEQMLFMLLSALAEFAISGTTITCKKLDGTTTSMTFTLDSATTPTSRTRAS